MVTLLSGEQFIDSGASWTDQEDGNGTIFAQNDLNGSQPTLDEWLQNGKKTTRGYGVHRGHSMV